MKRRIQRISHTLALGLWIGLASSCTPKLGNTLVEDNMMFAQLQLRVAFDEIDYARTNETPESRKKREKNGWGELTNPRNSEPDGSFQRLDQWLLSGRTVVCLRIHSEQFLEKESAATHRYAGTGKNEWKDT